MHLGIPYRKPEGIVDRGHCFGLFTPPQNVGFDLGAFRVQADLVAFFHQQQAPAMASIGTSRLN